MVQVYYSNDSHNDPVEKCLKWVLFLGRVIGAVPCTFEFKPRIKFRFRWCSFPTLHTIILASICFAGFLAALQDAILKIEASSEILEEVVGNLEQAGYRISVVFVYFYFLRNSKKLPGLMEHWSHASTQLCLQSVDRGFPKFCLVITICILGIGIAENILFDICNVDSTTIGAGRGTLLERLVKTNAPALFQYLPANMSAGMCIFLLYAMKMSTYTWNFGDIFLIVVCRAVSHKFKQMNVHIKNYIAELGIKEEEIVIRSKKACFVEESNKIGNDGGGRQGLEVLHDSQESIEKQGNNKNDKNAIHQADAISQLHHQRNNSWSQIRRQIVILCKLSEEWTSVVAPLVLACYGCNVYIIIKRIFGVLYNPNYSGNTSTYSYTSAVQFTLRVILVTFYTSQVYHSTEEIVQTLERTPDFIFTEATTRLERLLDRHPVGVTIFGAFRITRKFFISIVSFLFTTEIVLLQAMSATQQGKRHGHATMNENESQSTG